MPDISVCSLSGVYEREDFYRDYCDKGLAVCRDLTRIKGVNGYCAEDSREELSKLLKKDRNTRIHFIDNGNYHYLSLLWMGILMEKKYEEYALIYLDHHDDRQEAAFGGLLSCGSWVRDAENSLHGLHKTIWVNSIDTCLENENFLDRSNISGLHKINTYISIDKDILSVHEMRTNWDQGTMTNRELMELLDKLLTDPSLNVCGIDICGGPEPGAPFDDIRRDDEVNREILSFLCSSYLKL